MPKKKEDWVARLKKKVRSYFKRQIAAKKKKVRRYLEKQYAQGEKRRAKGVRETPLDKRITKELRASGVTEAEIDSLMTPLKGKK